MDKHRVLKNQWGQFFSGSSSEPLTATAVVSASSLGGHSRDVLTNLHGPRSQMRLQRTTRSSNQPSSPSTRSSQDQHRPSAYSDGQGAL